MKLSKQTFYDKVLGCWMGKNIGGTLGTPDEWKRQINDYTFYVHDINGDPLPNDDLDLQIIWLKCLEDNGINITAQDLGLYWQLYQIANFSEYGIAKANLNHGIMPPISGILGNAKKDSNGAWIRSEIWACICPGRPDLAVQYAYEDAIVDHGNGEGTYAEFFTATLEAAAFVEKDINKLIQVGLSYIPKDCGIAKAIETVYECYNNKLDWKECRDQIIKKHGGKFNLEMSRFCSIQDLEKGFDKIGVYGYDAPSNIAIIVAGLLYGEGDFEKSLLITANMGEDTDCTAGFVGSLFGIINGYSNLPQKWIEPIGHNIKTLCCNEAHNDYIPKTVEELTDRVINITRAVSAIKGSHAHIPCMDILGDEDDLSDVKFESLLFENTYYFYIQREVYLSLNGPRYDTPFFKVALDYEDYVLEEDDQVRVTVKIANISGPLPQNVNIKFVSDDLDATPGDEVSVNIWIGTGVKKIDFLMSAFETKAEYRGHFIVSTPDSITNLMVPVYFTAFRRTDD